MQMDNFHLTANPDEAQIQFDEFCKNYQANHHKQLSLTEIDNPFLKLFGNSPFLCRFVINNTWIYQQYQQSPYQLKEKPVSVFLNEVKSIFHTHAEPLSTLKKYKYQEYVRLTIKELLGHNPAEIYREFSCLAQAITHHLTEKLFDEFKTKYNLDTNNTNDFTLLAMGKLGGNELNYSSDIDIIGVYDEDKICHNITHHEFFSKFFASLGQVLSQQDQDGFLYRVDWDLRPEGKTGVLANSLGAMERYYQTFGEEWERQAYLKARPLFERADCGQRLLQMLTPFVYRKYFDEKTIKSIWHIKTRLSQEQQARSSGGFSVKLSPGGIRDIEFFTQGFQLLFAGKIPALKEQNTLLALDKLAKHKLITLEIKNLMTQSYLFLRRIESCLQMENEQQIHTIKPDATLRLKIARRLGFDQNDKEAMGLLEEKLFYVQSAVTKTFSDVYEPTATR